MVDSGFITDPNLGLTREQVRARTEQGLHNRVKAKAGRSEGQIITQNVLTFFNLVFVILAVILVLGGSSVKNMTFLVVVIVNTVIGIVQEIRAKRAVDKLSLVAEKKVSAIRDGEGVLLHSRELVQDDIVVFRAGDQICADGVVCAGALQVNEALLTGEADAIPKNVGDLVRSGSFVASGIGRVRLTQVGDEAFAAKLAAEARQNPKAAKSEMMRSLDKLIRVMGCLLVPVGLVLFYQEFQVLKLGLQESVEATVAALVGMIPEGLYLLTSVAMAASALKLTKDRVLVQDMNCIEALARVDVLCVDKTGTITRPEMEVTEIVPLQNTPQAYIEEIVTALYSRQEPDNDTARAIRHRFPGESGWECTGHVPFQSAYKWCGGTFLGEGSFLLGAPERLAEPVKEADAYLARGCRVLLLTRYADTPDPDTYDKKKAEPLALLILQNPIRENAEETFRYFQEQGVTVKVISGDNPVAASRVACQAGIARAERYVDADTLSAREDFLRAVETYTVFGRVTPDKKKQLILALRDRGHTVAMTGDGVNDVLAMKQAHCGVAMASGAQAASQVAKLVLTDSDFGAMPAIVAEGRRVINNIQRAAALFLVKNIFSLTTTLFCIALGWAYPFAPFHLSVISALTIGVPSFFLAMEPNYERVEGKFLPTVLRRALPGGLTNMAVVTAAHAMMVKFGLPLSDSSTVCTAVLAVVGMLVLFGVCRPFDTFRKAVWGAMGIALLGSFLVLGVPFDLTVTDPRSYLVLTAALLMAPTVLYLFQRLFILWDKWRKSRKML